jgi:phage-related protein
MATPTNLFQELKDLLTEFKGFLDTNVPVIKPAINALAALIPQINELITKLVDLMGKLKTEIDKLDVANIPGLDKVSEFTTQVKNLLTTAKGLLPAEAGTIDDILSVANVVSGLPSLDEIKTEIKNLIDAITAHLNSLKSA